MLKDRRALMEQEIEKQKKACGALYLCIIRGESGFSNLYNNEKERLSEMLTEMIIVDQMIKDGHQ